MTDKTVPHTIERGIYFLFANRRFGTTIMALHTVGLILSA